MSSFGQDLRLARRSLGRRRGWTAAGVAALTIGIAGSILAVSLLDQVLVRPLDFRGGQDLVTLYLTSGASYSPMPYDDYTQFRTVVDEGLNLAAFWRVFMPVAGGAFPERNQGEFVSGNYFAVLGVRPALGRLIVASDNVVPGGHPVVVLSERLWRRQFASDPKAVDKEVRLDGIVYDIIGVAPAGFQGTTYESRFWIPAMMAERHFRGRGILTNRTLGIFQTVGRLTSGFGLDDVQARIDPLDAALSPERVPPYYRDTAEPWRARMLPGHYLRLWPEYRDDVARFLTTFGAMALAALAAACANMVTLLLARSREWRQELAIRQVLGAGLGGMLRRVATEVGLLLLLGGFGAAVLTYWLAPLTPLVPLPVPVQLELSPDGRVVIVGMAAIAVVAVLFAALPVYQVVCFGLNGQTASRTHSAGRWIGMEALVVGQVALSCSLVVGCVLLVQSAWRIGEIDPGFRMRHGASASLDLPGSEEDGFAGRNVLISRLLDRLVADEGITRASMSTSRPLSIHGRLQVELVGAPGAAGRELVAVAFNAVTAGYFETFGIPLSSGRVFTRAEAERAVPVALVNRALADRYFSGRRPVGETLRLADEDGPRRIIGVVGDTAGRDIRLEAAPFVYLPLYQRDADEVELAVAFRVNPGTGAEVLRRHVAVVVPTMAVSEPRTFEELRRAATGQSRMQAQLAGVLTGSALTLAVVGLYGLVAYWVRQREREFGIRMALGATPWAIVRLVAWRGCVVGMGGSLLGIGLAVGASGLLSPLVYGGSRGGLGSAIGVGVVSIGAVVLASCGPAWYASRLNPTDALKAE